MLRDKLCILLTVQRRLQHRRDRVCPFGTLVRRWQKGPSHGQEPIVRRVSW